MASKKASSKSLATRAASSEVVAAASQDTLPTPLPNDPQAVVQCVCEAIRANADDLRRPLFDFLEQPGPRTATALRLTLTMLASGVERGAHDGSTFPTRVQAAKSALAAWG